MTLTSNDGMGALPKHDDSTDMLREWDVAIEQTCHFSENTYKLSPCHLAANRIFARPLPNGQSAIEEGESKSGNNTESGH